MTEDSMISAACLVNRPERCRGVISLAYVGPCAGPAHDPEPDPEEVEADRLADDLLEIEAEARLFGEVA